ncbi:Imidazoleglycerol-phosphate dehydratase [Actinidia chinensis var. chinensis]|uniref:Imidazoleglycerol-phosphate dehydratase n=1 Tax=Actinidia chinensis var. chinensis TaxID=1590841 RepID=A0A2R6PK51_ACTCC|nr:Imidazoleglycerol-phosphate dehydratase [Actinidia chinensis var. chinensis]
MVRVNLTAALGQLASHGLFDVHVKATGDIHIDDHHINEDVAFAIGTVISYWHSFNSLFLVPCSFKLGHEALLQALGDRKGINHFSDFSAPLDEALIYVPLDSSRWPHLSYDLCIPTERVGKRMTRRHC